MGDKSQSTYLSAFSSERGILTNEILEYLVPVLNELHGLDYSLRFWKIIIGPYINSVVSRRKLLTSGVASYPPLPEPINGVNHPGVKERFLNRFRIKVKSFQTRRNLKTISDSLLKNDNVAFGFHDMQSITKEIGTYLPAHFPNLGNPIKDKRTKVVQLSERENDIYYKNIIYNLPQVYVEYFDEMISKVPLHQPFKKIFHTSFIDSFFMKFLVALYVEKGAKLYYYQHGAYYGEMTHHNAYLNESSIADKFITWGWELTEKDVPGKAYRLEKFKREYSSANTGTYNFDILFCYPQINDRNRVEYKKYTDDLSKNLDREKYRKLLARPRPNSKLPFVSHKIGFDVAKTIDIDSAKKSMYEVLAKSRVVVQFTVPSTNFTECLYVDHPTVGLLNNDNPTDIVKPYYEFFLKQGVLHKNFDSLIAHLNTINLDEWWAKVTAHQIYKDFKNEFLRAV